MNALHITTPLLKSSVLSLFTGKEVYLKMDALQPSASFKIRGVGFACQEYRKAGATRLVCASGGNAGYAVAYAGNRLGMPGKIVVPKTTPIRFQTLIGEENAQMIVYGKDWDDAHKYAIQLVKDKQTAYIHPFDDPRLWIGHASIILEVKEQGIKPDAVILSVGGGGLLCGVLEGLHQAGWGDVPVIAMETNGADSFARSISSGRLVTLDKIESVATSLGARTVSTEALRWIQKHEILPWVISDRQAVDAVLHFADDHRILVEPACGAALAALYLNIEPLARFNTVLVIVCGGAGVTRRLLDEWDRNIV